MKSTYRANHTTNVRGEREENGEVVLRGVDDLSAKVHSEDGKPCVTSHWQPDEDDLRILNAGGVIELDVLAVPPPPVRVTAVPLELSEEEQREVDSRGGDPSGRAPGDDWSERGHTQGKA